MIIALQLFLLSVQIFSYYLSPDIPQFSSVFVSVASVLLSSVLAYGYHYNSILKNKLYSVSFVLLVMLLIVNIQVPIDYLLGNTQIIFSNYFYNSDQICVLCAFSSSLIISYNIGMSRAFTKGAKRTNNSWDIKYKIKSFPVLLFCLVFFVLFILTINGDYVNGGHGVVLARPLSLSFYSWYLRFAIIYLAISYFNTQSQSLKRFVLTISPLFYLSVVISSTVFLLANNRVYVLYILIPLVFLLLRKKQLEINIVSFIIITLIVGSFATAFKIFGFENIYSNPIKTLSSLGDLDNYAMLTSFSPFTAELSASIYASSVLLYLYNTGYFLWGAGILIGFLKIFPGVIGFMIILTGIDIADFDAGVFITKYTASSYGLGTNFLGESLINFGFPLSILVLFFVGYQFAKSDLMMFSCGERSFTSIILWVVLSSNVVFLSRGSISDLIGMIGFCVFFGLFYTKLKYIKNK